MVSFATGCASSSIQFTELEGFGRVKSTAWLELVDPSAPDYVRHWLLASSKRGLCGDLQSFSDTAAELSSSLQEAHDNGDMQEYCALEWAYFELASDTLRYHSRGAGLLALTFNESLVQGGYGQGWEYWLAPEEGSYPLTDSSSSTLGVHAFVSVVLFDDDPYEALLEVPYQPAGENCYSDRGAEAAALEAYLAAFREYAVFGGTATVEQPEEAAWTVELSGTVGAGAGPLYEEWVGEVSGGFEASHCEVEALIWLPFLT